MVIVMRFYSIFGHHDEAAAPSVRTSKQTSQTRVGLVMLYLIMSISLLEHLEHKRRPQ